MNPFFGAMGGVMNPMAMLSQLQSNPMGLLRRAGFNVPDGTAGPQAIIQHLMNSGQISQQQVDNARMMAQNFGLK